MKIGIACVYYVPEDSKWILNIQLAQIIKHTNSHDFTIYAADIRLPSKHREILVQNPHVKICSLNPVNSLPNREHGESLTQLVRIAADDNCDLIITLDVDSFPISDNWINVLHQKTKNNCGVCAVFRAENEDTYLPHPCGTALTQKFIKENQFDFYPDNKIQDSIDFQKFIASTKQRVDTGIGLAFILWMNKMDWPHLYRTNKKDYHDLMAGIYGDIIFHFGASSRAPVFHKDINNDLILRLTSKFEKLPGIWRFVNYRINKKKNKNQKIAINIRNELQKNPATLIASLKKR